MPRSVYEMFQNTVASRRDRVAAQIKLAGAWRDVTWGELDKTARQVAAGLVKVGVQPKQMVSLMANTRIEWIQADLGILGAGATTVPIYQSTTADDTAYILNDAGSVAIIVEDEGLLKKLRAIKHEVPQVKKVIAMTGAVDAASGWEMTWEQLLADGAAYLASNEAEVKARAATLAPEDVLTLIYTSGTTGRPKGTIITHDNMIYQAEVIKELLMGPDDNQYLFLPMAHVFAKVLESAWLHIGHTMSFWEGDMKKIVDNLGEVRPTLMCAVPRIFEKVYAKVVSDATSTPGIQGKIARWAIAEGEKAARAEDRGEKPGGLAWTLAQQLVWKKIGQKLKARFGGRMRYFVSGGAPLSKDIAYFFKYAGVTILEGYGLTETSASVSVNLPEDNRIGTVGRAMRGTEFKIAPDGEILIRGRCNMKGYHNRPDATAEVLDQDGWFHTGDIGSLDKDGFLKITDRKKDIIVTAGGKNVAPQNLENLIKSKSPLISQAVVHGDKRKFLSVLITVDEENVSKWANDNGLGADFKSVTQSKQLNDVIQNVVKDVNGTLPSYETLKKFKILDHDFVVGDQLTPSLKVKRKVCNEKYKDIFDGFYASDVGGGD